MSLIDTNCHVYDNSEIKSFQDHRVNVSLVGQKDQDEKKQNTLQDDAVTLSYNTESQHSFNANNKKLPKALRAYLENQPSTVKEDENKDYALPDPIFNKDDDKGITEEDKKTEKEQEEYKSKGNDKKQNGQYLDDEEQDKVDQMKARDEEVRVHENAHKAAGGSYAGAPQYEYEKGPDGKSYVTDGHVNIDVGKESTPEKTVEKMKVVINAANAPAEPSSQDRKVASQARQQLNEAQQELSKEKLNSSNKAEDKTAPTADATSSQAPTL